MVKLKQCLQGEDELYVDDRTVVWSRGDGRGSQTLIKTLTVDSEIEDVTWCEFPSESKRCQSIVAATSFNLEVFVENGQYIPVKLPFQVERMFSMANGLVIQRVPGIDESLSKPPLPILFTIDHPLQDFHPVVLRSSPRLPQGASFLTVESKYQVVGVIKDWSIVILYSTSTKAHSLWLLRPVCDEELEATTIWNSCGAGTSETTFGDPRLTADHSQLFSPSLNRSVTLRSPSMMYSFRSNLVEHTSSPFRGSTIGLQHSTIGLQHSTIGFQHSTIGVQTPHENVFSPKARNNLNTESRNLLQNDRPSTKMTQPCSPRMLELETGDDTVAPIFPEYTVELIWSEMSESNEKATKVMTTTDLSSQNFLVLLLPKQGMIRLTKVEEDPLTQKAVFGTTTSIPGKDVEVVPSRNMMLVLDSSDSLILYSGSSKIANLYLPSVHSPQLKRMKPRVGETVSETVGETVSETVGECFASTSSPRCSLQTPTRSDGSNFKPRFPEDIISPVPRNDSILSEKMVDHLRLNTISRLHPSIGDRVTIETHDSKLFRFSIPSFASSKIVQMALDAFKHLLPKSASQELVIQWFRTRNSIQELDDCKELSLFKQCILSLIGYEIEDLSVSQSFINVSVEVAKKMKIDDEVESRDDDWNWLKERSNGDGSCSKPSGLNHNILTPTTSSILFAHLPTIFVSLHLIYEELKLNQLVWSSIPNLLDILYLMACDLRKISYQDYYWRDFPSICSQMNQEARIPESDFKLFHFPAHFTEIPPSIFSFLSSILRNENGASKESLFPIIPGVTERIHDSLLLFSLLKSPPLDHKELLVDIAAPSALHLQVREYVTYLNSSENVNMKREEKILCLMDSLTIEPSHLDTFPHGLSIILWESIFSCRSDPPSEWPSSRLSLIGRSDLLSTCQLSDGQLSNFQSSRPQNRYFGRRFSKETESDSEEGLCHLDTQVLRLLFPEDQRVNEAWNMLQSSKPVKVNIVQRSGVNDHDYIEEQERHLYTICIRTMALSIGRGMFTLRSYKPVVAETFPVPKLCLTGRSPPRNGTIDLSHIEVPPNMTTWPLFHNGVAAGLRACTLASDIIDSSWIVYNKPKSSQSAANDALNEHAGFLLALGLNGHLSRLSTMNVHDYLCRGNELTRVAIILGLAAARRGTMDTSAVKVMSIHVEALLPPTSTELDVPPVVQVAAVMGIGLLYQGSGHSHIAEILLEEIGRPPGPEMEHYIDRESYALAAGMAFGLVTLGKGNEMMSASSSSDGSSSIADQLCTYMIGGHKKPLSTIQREKYKTPSYQIREGDHVNADVTSPGATLGLGFLFFDTNNHIVAKWVTAPDTQYLLEAVRPDFLLLRTLTKGLILWSSVSKTRDWVESHIPSIVARHAFQRHESFDSRIDYETMSQAYCNIVAGACFVLGLKYAGSGDRDAFKVVMGYAKMFLSLPNKPQLADQAGRSTIEACLNVLVLSLALIMAGTGNLEVMRICRYLRSRTSQVNVVLYGSHLATHMALGLLFLGGCRFTISTAPFSIAVLVMALFPKFPIHSHDNRYHLQAFRHLYALAVEPRLIIPRDIDSGQVVYVHMKVLSLNSSEWKELKAPCFIPQLDSLQKVIVHDPRYWKITFDKSTNWHALT